MKHALLLNAMLNAKWAMRPQDLASLFAIVTKNWGMQETQFAAADITAAIIADAAKAERLTPAQDRKIASQQGSVAVIPIMGIINNRMALQDPCSGMLTHIDRLRAQINSAANNQDIKAIVLDINSPGGTVGGVPELSKTIFDARAAKPIIAQVDDGAYSAAYWLASAASEIVVTPSGGVGSVGVYSMHEDISKYLEAEGIKETFISAGKYKVEGNPFEPLSDEARAAIQQEVDQYYGQFIDDLARNRGMKTKAVESGFGQGRSVMARDAVAAGMADRIGTMQETLVRFGVSMYAPGSSRKSNLARSAREIALIEATE